MPPDAGGNGAATGTGPAPDDRLAGPTSSPGGVTVGHASPSVSSSARPRARGAEASAPAAAEPSPPAEPDPSPAPEIPREPVDPATLTPPGSVKAKAAGRRGGLARMKGL